MKARLDQIEAAAQTVESLRLELERSQRELNEYRLRMGELERAEALLTGENRLLEMVARGSPLPEILGALCRLIEELSSGCLCGILLVDLARNRVEHGAAPSLPPKYNEAIHGRTLEPSAGPCGMAACCKEQVIAADIASDTRWKGEWRTLALSHGLRACWSSPILSSDGSVLGTFAIYWREPRSPTELHHKIIEQTTDLAAIAIDRKKAEEELRRSEAYLAEAQRLSLTGSFGWNVSSGAIIWSKETYCILGYDGAIKPNLDLVFQRVHAEDRTLVQQTIDRATRNGTDLDFEHRLLMPDGAVKRVHVVARATKAESGAIEFVGAVMDVTEQRKIEEALRASEKLACGQVEALKSALDALAKESTPDRLVEHILRTLTEKFDAHSSSVWRRDEANGMIGFEFAFEDGRILNKNDSRFAGMDLWLPMDDFWPWPEVFRTGKASVIEDIRTVRPFALRDRLLTLGIVTVLLIPMSVVGRLEGAIGLRFTQKRGFRPEEIELAQALGNQAMLAMQLTRLSAESRESAVIGERNRMARDIHDTLAQGLTGVIMQLEAVKGAIAQNDLAEATDRIERAGDLARVGLGEARRSVLALRPRSLQDTSLCMALDDLLKRMTNGSGLQAEFHLEGDEPPIPAEWEEGLLRVAQESLTNTIKHAKAKNFRATLTVGAKATQFRLVDDGSGFDLHTEHEGFGLLGMKERVDQMGGQFILRSMPGQGTEIQIILNNPASAKPDNEGKHA